MQKILLMTALLLFSADLAADDLSEMAHKIGTTESRVVAPASVGAMDYICQRFYGEQFKVMLQVLPKMPQDKQKAKIEREIKLTGQFKYLVWEMLPEQWAAFQRDNAGKNLVLFESVESDDGDLVNYVAGIGAVSGNSVKLLTQFNRSSIGHGNLVASELLLEKVDFIEKWNQLVDEQVRNRPAKEESLVFDLAKVRIIGAISIPFMEYTSEHLRGKRSFILDRLDKACDNNTLDDEIAKLQQEYARKDINPLVIGEQWRMLQAMPGEVSFYHTLLEKNGLTLYEEEGFQLKRTNDVIIKFPTQKGFIKYHYDKRVTKDHTK